MKIAVLLGICLISLIGVHAQAVIQFNSSVPCSEANSCSLTDPSIYLGGIAPNATDEVLINTTANANNTFFFLPSNATFVVSKLTVLGEGSHLQLNPNSTLAVTEGLEFSGFLLWIDADALLRAEEAEITGSLFFIYGLAQIKSLAIEESVISANDNGALFTEEFEFENGSIIFHDESTVFRSVESEFEDSHLVFNNRPFLGDVEFEHVVAFFPNGFFVEDHYVISNSNFSAYFPDELANVTLTLAGHNNLSISNFIFGKTKFNNTGSPFITFNINNNATFNGSIEVPGEIVLGGGSNVVFNGNISLSGGLTADVNDTTQVQAFGFLRCGSPIKLVGHDGRHTFALDSAVLAAPNITVDRFELQVIGRTVLVGDVINNGFIHIFEESALHIHGNYSQESNASLAVYNLNASANRTINVQINGTATLDGHFRYNATETKNKTTVTVLHATSRVGFFASEEYDAASTAGFTPKLVYEANYVNVTITPTEEGTPHKFLGLYWWVWLIIAVGGATLLIAVIVGAVFMRKRSQYEALRTR